MRPIFDIDIVDQGDIVIVVVVGEIDLVAVPRLEAELRRAEATDARTVVVDLERVAFMDAAGLAALTRHAFSAEHGKRLRITPGPPQVRRLFEVTGLDVWLPVLRDGPDVE